jgi:hypothetical protein
MRRLYLPTRRTQTLCGQSEPGQGYQQKEEDTFPGDHTTLFLHKIALCGVQPVFIRKKQEKKPLIAASMGYKNPLTIPTLSFAIAEISEHKMDYF